MKAWGECSGELGANRTLPQKRKISNWEDREPELSHPVTVAADQLSNLNGVWTILTAKDLNNPQ